MRSVAPASTAQAVIPSGKRRPIVATIPSGMNRCSGTVSQSQLNLSACLAKRMMSLPVARTSHGAIAGG
jgi:hypothetical protein